MWFIRPYQSAINIFNSLDCNGTGVFQDADIEYYLEYYMLFKYTATKTETSHSFRVGYAYFRELDNGIQVIVNGREVSPNEYV